MYKNTGPAVVPSGTHYPAGDVSPAAFENAQRHQMRLQILIEREEAARAGLEAEIDRRLAVARGA